MSTLDNTKFSALLKELYTPQAVHDLVYSDNPFFAMVKKFTKFEGIAHPVPLTYGGPQGIGSNFAKAKANKTSSAHERFLMTRVSSHGFATISNETILASRSDKGAFIRALKSEVDGLLRSHGQRIAVQLYRDKGATIGQIAATQNLALDVLTLRNPSEVTNFEIGMTVQFVSTKSGGTVRASTLKIDSIDRNAGTLKMSAALNTIASISANDFIVVDGNYDLGVDGLDAWLPTVAPGSSDNFFSVNRSKDVTRLAGQRYDGRNKTVLESLVGGSMLVAREGGKANACFMSYKNLEDLVNDMSSKVQYISQKMGDISFEGVRVLSPKGSITVYGDARCPDDKIYLLQMDTWTLLSLDAAPHIFNTDGTAILRQTDEDGVEVRSNFYGNLSCNAPGWNCVILK